MSRLRRQQKHSQAALRQTRAELEQRVRELAAIKAKLKRAERLANIGYWERELPCRSHQGVGGDLRVFRSVSA